MDEPVEVTTETTVELNEQRCWPSHHDYVQAVEVSEPLLFCRLCGDVMALHLPPEV